MRGALPDLIHSRRCMGGLGTWIRNWTYHSYWIRTPNRPNKALLWPTSTQGGCSWNGPARAFGRSNGRRHSELGSAATRRRQRPFTASDAERAIIPTAASMNGATFRWRSAFTRSLRSFLPPRRCWREVPPFPQRSEHACQALRRTRRPLNQKIRLSRAVDHQNPQLS
jgi:hypothetical protein